MDFTYYEQFAQHFRPGDRIWVSGFRLAANAQRLVRNQPPVLAEICCTDDQDNEPALRAMGKKPEFVVPVGNNGTPDFKRASTPSDLHFVETMQEARTLYDNDLRKAKVAVDLAFRKLQRTKDRIDAILKSDQPG